MKLFASSPRCVCMRVRQEGVGVGVKGLKVLPPVFIFSLFLCLYIAAVVVHPSK